MALTAVLEFGDNSIKRYSKQYLVSDCRLLFDRPFNSFSPEGATRCERVEVTVVASGRRTDPARRYYTGSLGDLSRPRGAE